MVLPDPRQPHGRLPPRAGAGGGRTSGLGPTSVRRGAGRPDASVIGARGAGSGGLRPGGAAQAARCETGAIPMRTMVEFQARGVRYCLPVETTRAVRLTVGMVALPAPAPNVAGL